MSTAHPSPRPVAPGPRHRIGEVIAEIHVARPRGPLSAPDLLLTALRRELLPALAPCLDGPRLAGQAVQVDRLEIDLGDWPDDPDWDAVRAAFRAALESALAPYLHARPPDLLADLPARPIAPDEHPSAAQHPLDHARTAPGQPPPATAATDPVAPPPPPFTAPNHGLPPAP
ncbi:hypothetical protein [Rhodovulum marinum]|uniref:Uncharacterized protein n=1 Tax=Rhodovulum marinum TaxID=320662 RepID=A0A4R2Q0X7_9RHOB|nr:hypothetical protein [Rhodovulum marinum]TCP40191.1 hypothetical protein EV662_10865 [Rhodovulum marinum]